MAALTHRERLQTVIQKISTPTTNSHLFIPLSEEEKVVIRKYRLKDKKVALNRPTIHKPPPPSLPPTLTRFIQNARLPESDSDSSIDGFQF
jgi:hypothetical protein